ncbi:MAG: cytosine permease [Gammaproteobacteria bacterium]|jgi:cytosine permease|nr:cytosine permease [Gammaproteobacteria bacterium]
MSEPTRGGIGAALARLVERSPQRPVERDDQRSWFFLAAIQVGITICVPLFALGGQLGQHSRFTSLIPAVICGALIACLCAILTGIVGVRARVPTAVLMRRAFGEAGGKAVAGILILTLFGWFGVQTEMLVDSIRMLLASSLGLTMPRLAVTIACGAIMSSTAIIGFRALGKIAYVAVPLLLAVITVPTYIAVATHKVAPLLSAAPASSPYTFGLIVSIISGGHMVAVTVAPDITRFLRSPRDVVVGMLVSLGCALPVLLLLSALLAVIYGNANLIAILVAAGVGAPALLVIVLATWTSNDKNLYESALSLATLFPQRERWQLTALAGAVGTGLAAAGIFEHFIELLIFLGIAIAPIAGVYLVDFWREPARFTADIPPCKVRWRSFVAWICGIFAGFAALPHSSYGLELVRLTSIPTLDALLTAALSQWILLRTAPHGCGALPANSQLDNCE